MGRKILRGRNYFCIFYSFELKLYRMVELCIQKILCDVTRLTAKLKFQDVAKQINNFERA